MKQSKATQRLKNDLEDQSLLSLEKQQITILMNRGLLRGAARRAMDEKLIPLGPLTEVTMQSLSKSLLPMFSGLMKRSDIESVVAQAEVGDVCGAFRMMATNALLDYQDGGDHNPTPVMEALQSHDPRFSFFEKLFSVTQDATMFCPAFVDSLAIEFLDTLAHESSCEKHPDLIQKFNQCHIRVADLAADHFDVGETSSSCFFHVATMLNLISALPGGGYNKAALVAIDKHCAFLFSLMPSTKYFNQEAWDAQEKQLGELMHATEDETFRLLSRYGMLMGMSNVLGPYMPWGFDELEKLAITLRSVFE